VPRSSWNPHTPDAIGVEFFGVGVTNNVIAGNNDAYALQFRPQTSGFVSSIALYSGALTSNPILGFSVPNYFGQRRPWIVEVIPVSGYDPGAIQTAYFASSLTGTTDCVDDTFTAPDGDELSNFFDSGSLFQSGPAPMTATMQYDSTGFPSSGVQILSVAVETNVSRQAFIERIDQDNLVGWATLVAAGQWSTHMSEVYRDHGVAGYSLWTSTHVRQFDNAVGNRRMRFRGMDIQPTIYDYLNIHVDYITERRAGVGVVVPNGPYEWSIASMHTPGTTNPVPLTAGVEYMVVVRAPYSQGDYQSPGSRFDWRALSDVRLDGITPTHYGSLDWDLWLPSKSPSSIYGAVTTGLATQLQGLPGLRMLNGTTELADTEPYSNNYSGARPLKSTNTSARVKHTFSIVSGTTRYRFVKTNVAFINTTGQPGSVGVQLVNSGGTVIAGPVQITKALWDASPKIGQDIFGDEYHQVTVDLGVSVDIDNVTATTVEYILSDDAVLPYGDDGTSLGNPWRIGALVSEVIAATGSDQTAPSNASARGFTYQWPDGATAGIDFMPLRRGDLQTLLISEVPPITGTSISVLSMSVSGGACDGCPTTPAKQITVVGTGTAVAAADSTTSTVLMPPMPTQPMLLNDVILCLVSVRNFGVGTVNLPIGWRQIATNTQGSLRLFAKVALGGGFDTPPQVTFAGGATNETAIAQCAVIRGAKTDLSTIVTNSATSNFVSAQNVPWSALTVPATTDLGVRIGWKQDDLTSVAAETGFTRFDTPSSTLGSDASMIWEWQTGTLGWFGGSWTVVGGASAISASLSVSLAAATAVPQDDPESAGCYVRSIPYNHICWTPTTLTQENFAYYEVQRLEPALMHTEWQTIAIIAPTGSAVVTGAPVTGVASCFDDWTHVYDSQVTYRVRQRRADGGYSDFMDTVSGTTPSPAGADIIITAPMMLDHNVAFPEAHSSLPITHEWEMLDADQHEYRQIYGRDKFIEFRPLEKLGMRFKRTLIISALCTPKKPCIDVVHDLHEICQETTGLVVRDGCGNRWYAGVQVPSFTQLTDPTVGTIWLGDILVTEVATPVLTIQNVGQVQP
jgi:hypothetical protein